MTVHGTLLLFPGAGASREQSTLVAVDQAVAPEWTTVRADFPYRKEGRRAPDRPPKLLAAVRAELAAIGGPVVVGGRSMGGRMCSMVAAGADELAPPDGLAGVVLISYPLHPPGKPQNLRVEHLPAIMVPCLFVHGTRTRSGHPTSWRSGRGRSVDRSPTTSSMAVATTSRARTRRCQPSCATGSLSSEPGPGPRTGGAR